MIISYYPGAGGNRYLHYSLGKSFNEPGIAYDFQTYKLMPRRGMYLQDNDLPIRNCSDALLHNVNADRIQQIFPDCNNDVVIIKADLKSSLRREWSIKGKFKPMFNSDPEFYDRFILELYNSIRDSSWPEISSASEIYRLSDRIKKELFDQAEKNKIYIDNDNTINYLIAAYEAICWHSDLYKVYPMSVGSFQLVDIDNDDSEFCDVMRTELDLYKNNYLFNFAWTVFETHGNNAPIIDFYNEYKQQ